MWQVVGWVSVVPSPITYRRARSPGYITLGDLNDSSLSAALVHVSSKITMVHSICKTLVSQSCLRKAVGYRVKHSALVRFKFVRHFVISPHIFLSLVLTQTQNPHTNCHHSHLYDDFIVLLLFCRQSGVFVVYTQYHNKCQQSILHRDTWLP